MMISKALLLIFVTLASVTAQTFQYSRGWTNGKRDGHSREEVRDMPTREMVRDMPTREMVRDMPARDIARGISASLEKIISPCQMNKLRYVLEGKSLYNELLYMPCDSMDGDSETTKQRYKTERNQEPLLEVFQ